MEMYLCCIKHVTSKSVSPFVTLKWTIQSTSILFLTFLTDPKVKHQLIFFAFGTLKNS